MAIDPGSVVGRIYDAVCEPDVWPTAMRGVCDYVSAVEAHMFVHPRPPLLGSRLCMTTASSDLFAACVTYFEVNPVLPTVSRIRPGTVADLDGVMGPLTAGARDFIKWAAGIDCQYNMGGRLLDHDGVYARLYVHRGAKLGRFGPDDVRRAQLLVPHLQRAAILALKLQDFAEVRRRDTAILDRFTFGLVVCDEAARIMDANNAAERLLTSGDRVRGRAGKLGVGDGPDGQRLAHMIMMACREKRGGAIRVENVVGAPLLIYVVPLGPKPAGGLVGREIPLALVLISERSGPDDADIGFRDRLVQSFGLTPSEARLCALLGSGMSLGEVSDQLGVSRNTLRTHLRHVFDKTGTQRQGELVALTSRLIMLSTDLADSAGR